MQIVGITKQGSKDKTVICHNRAIKTFVCGCVPNLICIAVQISFIQLVTTPTPKKSEFLVY